MHQQSQLYFFVPHGPKSGRLLKMSVLCKFPHLQLSAQFLLSGTPYSTKEKALLLSNICTLVSFPSFFRGIQLFFLIFLMELMI